MFFVGVFIVYSLGGLVGLSEVVFSFLLILRLGSGRVLSVLLGVLALIIVVVMRL